MDTNFIIALSMTISGTVVFATIIFWSGMRDLKRSKKKQEEIIKAFNARADAWNMRYPEQKKPYYHDFYK